MKCITLCAILLVIPTVTVFLAVTPLSASSKYESLLETHTGREKLTALAQMEESRIISPTIIEPLLSDPNALIRVRCAEVLGRIADPKGVPYLEQLVEDDNENVVVTAAYALGLIGSEEVLEPLKNCLSNSPKNIRIRVLQALGMTTLPEAAPIISPSLTDFHSSVRTEAALAIASLQDSTAAALCLTPLFDPSMHVVASAVYTMGRLKFEKASKEIVPLLESEDRTVQLRAVEALGRLKEERAINQLEKLLYDKDRMTRIKAAEALARIGGKKCARALKQVLDSEDSHLKTVALGGIAASKNKDSFEAVVPLLGDDSPMVRIAAIRAAAVTGQDKAREYIVNAYGKGTPAERMAALEALGRVGMKEDLQLLAGTLVTSDDYFEREGAAAGLGVWKDMEELENPIPIGGETIRPIDLLVRVAGDDDWVVATTSIESLGRIGRPEVIPGLIRIYEARDSRLDSDRRLEIVNTVGALGEKLGDDERAAYKVIDFLRTATMDPDPRIARGAAESAKRFGITLRAQPSGSWKRGELPWGEPSLPLGERRIRIKTQRGDIDVLLFGDDAPNIVKSVIELANSGFYDGLTFHRVVPGFVIQGGCPRGDGWGDAGYFLRSQFNLHRYERGMVGMAHAGKDTPGSQIFITHAPQPHLDGRYTIIGKVTEGMEVVDRIEVGDTFSVIILE